MAPSFQIAVIFPRCKAVRKFVILGKNSAKPPPSLLRPTQGLFGSEKVGRSPCRTLVPQHYRHAEGFKFGLLFILLDCCCFRLISQSSDFATINRGFLWFLGMAFATKWAKSVCLANQEWLILHSSLQKVVSLMPWLPALRNKRPKHGLRKAFARSGHTRL